MFKDELLGRIYRVLLIWGIVSFPNIFYVAYYSKRFGMDIVAFSFTAYFLGSLIFEIPSGVFADVFGRKKSVIINVFLEALIYVVMPFVFNEWLFYAINFVWGGVVSFYNGAFDSWIVDKLKENKRENEIDEYYSNYFGLWGFGFIVSGLFMFILSYYGRNVYYRGLSIYDLLWWIDGFVTLITGFMLLKERENMHIGNESVYNKIRAMKHDFNGVFRFLINSKILIILLGMVFVYGLYSNFWGIVNQKILLDNGIKLMYFGLFYSFYGFVSVIISRYGFKIAEFFNKREWFFVFTNGLEILWNVVILFVFGPMYMIGYYIIKGVFRNINNMVFNSYIQGFIPKKYRATILSVKSFVNYTGLSLGGLVVGLLLKSFDLREIVFISSSFLFVEIFLWFYVLKVLEK